jgi:hypothetical protein
LTPWRRTALHKTAGVFSQRELTHVGLDVHRDSISVAILKPVDETPIAKRIFHDEASIRKLVGSFPDPSRVRACYEARPHRLRTPPTAPTAWGPLRRHRPVAHPEGARRPGEDRSSDARCLTLLPTGPASWSRSGSRRPRSMTIEATAAGCHQVVLQPVWTPAPSRVAWQERVPGWTIRVPKHNQVNGAAEGPLRALADRDPYVLTLRRFRFERPRMELLRRGNRLVLDVEEWVNKTSGRGPFRRSRPGVEGEFRTHG